MDHYNEINASDWLFLTAFHKPDQHSLEFTLTIGEKSAEPEDLIIEEVNVNLGPAYPIHVDETCQQFIVNFSPYICFNIVNESYASVCKETDVYTRQKIRIYERSSFLDYVKADSWASPQHPGEYKHYQFITNNHIINVASVLEPEIIKLLRK